MQDTREMPVFKSRDWTIFCSVYFTHGIQMGWGTFNHQFTILSVESYPGVHIRIYLLVWVSILHDVHCTRYDFGSRGTHPPSIDLFTLWIPFLSASVCTALRSLRMSGASPLFTFSSVWYGMLISYTRLTGNREV
jgi:hypothetical protein